MFYELTAPTWGPEEIEAIQRVIRSGQFTMGPEVAAFEREFAVYFGMKHGVMVNSGSSANLVAVAALAHRVAPPGVIEVSAKLGLPPLPPSQIILHCNALSPRARDALRILTTAFREHRTT